MVRYEKTRRDELTREPNRSNAESCDFLFLQNREEPKPQRRKTMVRRPARGKRLSARKLRRLEPVVFACAAIIAFVGLGCSLFSSLHKSSDLSSRPFSTVSVTVAPGDTLWSLAQRYEDPTLAPADRIDLIRQANPALNTTGALSPGETLLVPVTSSAVVPEVHLARALR